MLTGPGLICFSAIQCLEVKTRTAAEKARDNTNNYYLKMHERIIKRAKGADIDLVFIGDSLTEYWLTEGKEVWNKEFAAWSPGNFGLSGDTTYGVLWRLKQNEISGLHPKVVVVLIGTNDLSVGRGTQATAKAIGKVVETIKNQLPDTTIILLGLLPRGGAADPSRKLVSEVNGIISSLDNGNQIRYLDIGNSFLDKNGELIPELMLDSIHLSSQGYKTFAEAIKPTISKYLSVD